jgi:hypothetical protein
MSFSIFHSLVLASTLPKLQRTKLLVIFRNTLYFLDGIVEWFQIAIAKS